MIALSESECGKLFSGDTRSDIGSETEKMKFANAVNDLGVKFKRLDHHDESGSDTIVMERLYPLDYRSYEVEKRELIFEVFEDELQQLHKAGFVHLDIKRPSTKSGEPYDDVFLTDRVIRLIDVGISVLRTHVGDNLFDRYREEELKELLEFKNSFIER